MRNPRDPRLNETTGGTAPLNKFDACNITPSPPKHATKSTLSWRSLIFKQSKTKSIIIESLIIGRADVHLTYFCTSCPECKRSGQSQNLESWQIHHAPQVQPEHSSSLGDTRKMQPEIFFKKTTTFHGFPKLQTTLVQTKIIESFRFIKQSVYLFSFLHQLLPKLLQQ